MDEREIEVFGVKIKMKNKPLKINRETYVVIDKKNHEVSLEKRRCTYMKGCLNSNVEAFKTAGNNYFENILKMYEDDSFEYYTDDYCNSHRTNCLYNYDLNMKFFERLDESDFNNQIQKLLKKYKKIYEVRNLNDLKGKEGVYILVLQEYKQMYVGESKDIYKRIKQHWTERKKFMRLIFGSIYESVLSIDSFGPLDTTRIFVYEDSESREKTEEKILSFIPDDYTLNRTRGGVRGMDELTMKVDTVAHMKKRKLI